MNATFSEMIDTFDIFLLGVQIIRDLYFINHAKNEPVLVKKCIKWLKMSYLGSGISSETDGSLI